jgi:hypothetical protein
MPADVPSWVGAEPALAELVGPLVQPLESILAGCYACQPRSVRPFVYQAFGSDGRAFLVGSILVRSDVASSSTVALGFFGYLEGLVGLAVPFIALAVVEDFVRAVSFGSPTVSVIEQRRSVPWSHDQLRRESRDVSKAAPTDGHRARPDVEFATSCSTYL